MFLWLLFLGALLAGCGEDVQSTAPQRVKPVKVTRLTDPERAETRSLPGLLKAAKEADLAFRVPGRLIDRPVREGDRVEKGQLIARLDASTYEAAVEELKSRLSGARATLKEARLNHSRYAALLKEKSVSQSALDQAKSGLDNALAQVGSLGRQLEQAELNLGYTVLKAPFTGVLSKFYVENHENMAVQQPVARLEDLSRFEVEVEVPEFLLARIKKTDDPPKARAVIEAYPGRSFPLTLKEIQTTADPSTQTYAVTLLMDRPEGISLYPGMSLEVWGEAPLEDQTGYFTAPVSAVFPGEGDSLYVWQVDEKSMTVRRVKVKGGEMRGDEILIKNGFKPGDMIVVAGVNYLHQGMKVSILEGRIGGRR